MSAQHTPTPAIELSLAEIRGMLGDVRALHALVDWHDLQESEADSCGYIESGTYHETRRKLLSAEIERVEAGDENAKPNVCACNAHDDLVAAVNRVLKSGHFSIEHARNRTPEACDIRAELLAALAKAGAA